MDQSIICGIGNYMKCEILNAADINPLVKIGQLTDDKLILLVNSIYNVFNDIIIYGNPNINKYTNLIPSGNYKFKVYDKKMADDGIKINKIKTADGRMTYYKSTLNP
jgi:formamidopyrimidine-DNA glycosylase